MDGKYGQFTWGAPGCDSYYTNESGHASFLFGGNFKEYNRLHEEVGLQEYQVS